MASGKIKSGNAILSLPLPPSTTNPGLLSSLLCPLLLFGRSVVSDPWGPHGPQPARLPCPSPSPEACSDSRPLSTVSCSPLAALWRLCRTGRWIYSFTRSFTHQAQIEPQLCTSTVLGEQVPSWEETMIKKHSSVPGPLGNCRRAYPAGRTRASGVQLPALPLPAHRMPELQFPYLQNDAKSRLLQHCGRQRWGP